MEDERPRFQTDALGVIVSIAIREHVGNLIIILVPRGLGGRPRRPALVAAAPRRQRSPGHARPPGFVLGARLRTGTHLSDSLAGRWDRFSWYGIRGVRKSGTLGADMGNKQTTASELISTFESLLIAVTEPPRNRRREEIPGATLVVQHGAERPHAPASYLEELRGGMRDVVTRLDTIEPRLPPG
jgi:hypothetical protein